MKARAVTPCAVCGWQRRRWSEPDGCLGTLPGVNNACCGHGEPSSAYIQFTNGVTVRGFSDLERALRPVTPEGKK